jgi:hypothetical protein
LPATRDRRRSLGREIAIVLAVKLVALGALYFAFFSPSHGVPATAQRTAQVLFAGASDIRNK